MADKLFIPTIGTQLVLAEPWTFKVYSEYRNADILSMVNHVQQRYGVHHVNNLTLPVGTVLTVDRIYIKKGMPDFDSITFRASDYATNSVDEFFAALADFKIKKSIRFWVKLADANTIVYKSQE
jgi:hypothetical protein